MKTPASNDQTTSHCVNPINHTTHVTQQTNFQKYQPMNPNRANNYAINGYLAPYTVAETSPLARVRSTPGARRP